MANPIQQGLKLKIIYTWQHHDQSAAMANPIQQGLKPWRACFIRQVAIAAMANPIQQGLKHNGFSDRTVRANRPQWLIQYNKD